MKAYVSLALFFKANICTLTLGKWSGGDGLLFLFWAVLYIFPLGETCEYRMKYHCDPTHQFNLRFFFKTALAAEPAEPIQSPMASQIKAPNKSAPPPRIHIK